MRYYSLLFLVIVISSCGTKKSATNSSHKSVEEKYSQLLGVSKEDISNKKLYSFIDEWYGVPYKYGGKNKSGVDCSDFATILFKEVYGKDFSGSSESMSHQSRKISSDELHEGDLVFFKIDSKDISHVGIYLQNNKFVHATTKAGVMIDDLNEEYYKKCFESAGRIIGP